MGGASPPRFSATDFVVLVILAVAIGSAVLFVLGSDPFGTRGPGLGVAFSHTDSARVIPRALVRYELAGRVDTGLQTATAVAAGPADRIYVAGDRSVRVFDREGNPAAGGVRGLEASPRCLAVDAAGRFYAGVGPSLHRFEADGKRLHTFEQPDPDARVNAVALSEQGVFTAVHRTAGSGSVIGYDLSGEMRLAIPLEDVNLLNRLLDLVALPDGLRVTDAGAVTRGRVRVYSYAGRFQFDWGPFDATGELKNLAGCCNPAHIAALPDGRLVVSEKGEQAIVKVYHADRKGDAGRLESVVAELRGARGLDLAVDSRGRILVLDAARSAVLIFQRRTSDE